MNRPRPHMPLSAKLDAAILQLGMDPRAVDFDHDPALGLRIFDEATRKYTPDANDPKFITIRARTREDQGHKAKTFGTGGTSAGSDIHRIAKIKRVSRDIDQHQAVMVAKVTGEAPPPKKRKAAIRSPKFPKQHRPMQGRNTFERRK